MLTLPRYIIYKITDYAEDYSLLKLYLLMSKNRKCDYVKYSLDIAAAKSGEISTEIGGRGDLRSYKHCQKYLQKHMILTSAAARGQIALIKYILNGDYGNFRKIAARQLIKHQYEMNESDFDESYNMVLNNDIKSICKNVSMARNKFKHLADILGRYFNKFNDTFIAMAIAAAYNGHLNVLQFLAEDVQVYFLIRENEQLNPLLEFIRWSGYDDFGIFRRRVVTDPMQVIMQNACNCEFNIKCVKYLAQFKNIDWATLSSNDDEICRFLREKTGKHCAPLDAIDEFKSACGANNTLLLKKIMIRGEVHPEDIMSYACIFENQFVMNYLTELHGDVFCQNCQKYHE